MKEKLKNTLGEFLKHNKDYGVNVYIRNGITGNIMLNMVLAIDRNIKLEDMKYSVSASANVGDIKCCNNISLPYDEIMDCYEERDEYNSQTVHVIMKNGMKFEFECCGERL